MYFRHGMRGITTKKLVVVLVLVVVFFLLLTILLPVPHININKARQVTCMSQLRQLAVAAQMCRSG